MSYRSSNLKCMLKGDKGRRERRTTMDFLGCVLDGSIRLRVLREARRVPTGPSISMRLCGRGGSGLCRTMSLILRTSRGVRIPDGV